MNKTACISIDTDFGEKHISVLQGDIADLNVPLDIMMVSTFYHSYHPTKTSMIGALMQKNISVKLLAAKPEFDLRESCNIWLSKELLNAQLPISRIGCVELRSLSSFGEERERDRSLDIMQTIRAYTKMIELASCVGIKTNSLGFSIFGTGNLHLSVELVLIPLLNECLQLLKSTENVQNIYIIERSAEKAEKAAQALQRSYSIAQQSAAPKDEKAAEQRPLAFISYSQSSDKNVADNLCARLERNGIRVWYAPRDVDCTDYATAIVNAISRSTHFIVILSHNSLKSPHVLNEVDLAFQELNRRIRFYPLKLDSEELGPAFKYYLSRQHWMDATYPPLEERLDEFVDMIKNELNDGFQY